MIELDRENPDLQWKQLKEDHPFGFDVVVRPFIGFAHPSMTSSPRLRLRVQRKSQLTLFNMFVEEAHL